MSSMPAGRIRSLLLFGAPLLAGLALLVGGFYLHVHFRQQYLLDYYLRALGVVAQKTESSIGALQEGFANAVQAAGNAQDVRNQVGQQHNEQANLPAAGAASRQRLAPDGAAATRSCRFRSVLDGKLRLIPGLTPAAADGLDPQRCGTASAARPCTHKLLRPAPTQQTSLSDRVGAQYRTRRDDVSVSGDLVVCAPKPLAVLDAAPECEAERSPAHACAAADFETLVGSAIAGSPLDGTTVFVSDADGRILYERGGTGLRIAALPTADDAAAAGGSASSGIPRLPRVADLGRATGVTTLPIDGVQMLLLTQPVRVMIDGANQDERWVVGALLPLNDMGAQTSVSFAAMGGVPLVLTLVLLATPFLTWMTLGPRDALRLGTALGMLGSLAAGTALLTTLAVTWYAYSAFDAQADAETARVAAAMQRNVGEELAAARATLQSFIAHRRDAARSEGTKLSEGYVVCRRLLGRQECVSDDVATPPDEAALLQALRAAPHFEMLMLADRTGQQREKWTIRSNSTPMINVGRLQFFRDAMEGRVLPTPPGALPVTLNVMASPNTGETLAIMAAPVTTGAAAAPIGVAAIVPHWVSLVNPVLPPDTSFAVVENDGRVLFHSDSGRRLFENYFAESDGAPQLRAAVFARHAARLSIDYQGRAQRVHVAPLAGTPWSLIVARDKEMLRTVALESGITRWIGFLLWGVLYGLVGMGVRALLPADPLSALWPDRAAGARYLSCVLVLALLAAWQVGAQQQLAAPAALLAALLGGVTTLLLVPLYLIPRACWSPPRLALLWSALLLCVGLALAISVPQRGLTTLIGLAWLAGGVSLLTLRSRPGGASRWSEYAYAGIGALALVTLSVLPAVVLTRDATQMSAEALARRGGWRGAALLAAHHEQVDAQYGGVDGNDVARASLAQHRWDLPGMRLGSVEQRADATAVETPPRAATPSVAWCGQAGDSDTCVLMARHLTAALLTRWPVYSEESLQLRHAVWERASDDSWYAPLTEDGAVEVRVDDPHRRAAAASRLRTAVYRLALPSGGAAPVAVALLVVLLAAAVLGLHRLAVWLFGLHLPDGVPDAGASEPSRGRLFVAPDAAALAAATETAYRVDLQRLADAEALQREAPPPQRAVLLLHLERCIAAPAWQAAVAAWLERALAQSAAVDVVSALDPAAYFADGEAAPDPATRQAQARFARALSVLRVVPVDAPAGATPDPRPIDDALARETSATPRLRGIAADLRGRLDVAGLDREALVEAVGAASEPYYRALWCALEDDERLALYHLARYGFVSPRAWPAVRRLMRRGLVRRGTAVRPMNESFRRFVLRAEARSVIASWERAGGAHRAWLRDALIAGIVVVAVVLFLARPDAIGSWVAFFTALATVGTKATDLLGLFQVRKEAKV
ncbi:MAG: cache domain-containing protein [Deltaproteobacteria bacterium]|nr:cache domain-containing protein [Deltaproteobacteria bacterium]